MAVGSFSFYWFVKEKDVWWRFVDCEEIL